MMVAESTYSVTQVREHFPILSQKVNGKDLIYFDNAASSQKPISVIESLNEYYREYHSNIHRGAHYLANKATEAFELTREKSRAWLNANSTKEIIFTSGTTDAINLVAQTWGRANLQEGDEVVIAALEHHSNIVPWQMICQEKGAVMKVIALNDDQSVDQDSYKKLLSSKTKLVAVNHISNSLGVIQPIKEMAAQAHAVGALIAVDGAQSAPHLKIDVQDLDVDFYSVSGHKMYGPTGVGILYGKEDLLQAMPPWRGGGEMIKTVTFEGTTYNELPHKFEAGTPNIAGVIALGFAIDFMTNLGISKIATHENDLRIHATTLMKKMDGMRIFGDVEEKAGVISFLVDGVHPYDAGTLLDKMGVAVRTGHHCTEPLMNLLQIPGTIRASFACYNTHEEVEIFVGSLKRAIQMLK